MLCVCISWATSIVECMHWLTTDDISHGLHTSEVHICQMMSTMFGGIVQSLHASYMVCAHQLSNKGCVLCISSSNRRHRLWPEHIDVTCVHMENNVCRSQETTAKACTRQTWCVHNDKQYRSWFARIRCCMCTSVGWYRSWHARINNERWYQSCPSSIGRARWQMKFTNVSHHHPRPAWVKRVCAHRLGDVGLGLCTSINDMRHRSWPVSIRRNKCVYRKWRLPMSGKIS